MIKESKMHVWSWDLEQYADDENLDDKRFSEFDSDEYFTSQGYKKFGSSSKSDSDSCSHGIFECERAREKGFSEFVLVTLGCDEDFIEFYVK